MADKDCSAQIVAAARKRFQHFGYGKTSMADIAGDCGMSPGNIYRFFPGKLDIAEAIAIADYKAHLEHLRRVGARPGISARQKLRDVLVESLRRTYTRFQKDPRALELVQVVAAERPTFSDWMAHGERQIMMDVMEEGEDSGAFVLADRAFTAETIQSATLKFRLPKLWSETSLPKLERELEGVLNLLLEGLAGKSRAQREIA